MRIVKRIARRTKAQMVGENHKQITGFKRIHSSDDVSQIRESKRTSSSLAQAVVNLISWNCHGLGTPCAVGALRKLLLSEALNVVFLMETRKLDSELQAQRGLAGYNNIFVVSWFG